MNRLLTLIITGLILNSCWPCDCFNWCDPYVSLYFDTSGTSRYLIEDIDTVQLIELENGSLIPADTIILTLDTAEFFYDAAATCTGPFGLSINFKYDDQEIYIGNCNIITQNNDTFKVRDVYVEGRVKGRTCKCYFLEKKKLSVDGVKYDLSEDNSVILLHRK